MRDGWREVRLGEILTRSVERLGSTAEPRILTVTEGHGLVDQMTHWGRRVAAEDTSTYKVVRPEDIVYNVYLLWNGAIGQNLFGEVGVTSPVYEVFTPSAEVLGRYIGLAVQSPQMMDAFDTISIGTIPRRRRAPWTDFLALKVILPTLAEQRRIVDLVEAVGHAIGASELAQRSLAGAADLLRSALPEAEWVPLDDVLVAIESGTSTKPVEGEGLRQRMLTLAAIRPASFRPSEVKDVGVAQLPAKALVRNGDLLITRSNTPDRVGYAALARGMDNTTYMPDLVWRLRTDDSLVRRDYLAQVLSSRSLRAAITAAASGTSMSMRKINKANFGRINVPLPSLEVQAEFAARLELTGAAEDAIAEQLQCLHRVRTNLLDALLSGEHEIPESYDALLAG